MVVSFLSKLVAFGSVAHVIRALTTAVCVRLPHKFICCGSEWLCGVLVTAPTSFILVLNLHRTVYLRYSGA